MKAAARLDQYLAAFKRALRRLTILRGLAIASLALLALAVSGSWLAAANGFAADTIIAFRLLLALGLALIALRFIFYPLRDLEGHISRHVEQRSPAFRGRVETYLQMQEDGNPLRELLAEDALRVSEAHPVSKQVKAREFNVAGALIAVAVSALIYLLIAGPGMLNFSLRNFFAGWAVEGLLPPQVIIVSPGDQHARRGANLRVSAVMEGFSPDEAIIHVRSSEDGWQEVSMARNPAGFEFTFFFLQENLSYYVSSAGLRSPEYEVQVVDVPAIESLSLTYHYPQWTEREPETFTDGDIRTLPDTRVELSITTTAPLMEGELVLNEVGQALELDGVQAAGDFLVASEGEYFIAAIVGGERVRLSDDYFIRLTEDEKPGIEFTRPGQDWNASSIEEVTARLAAQDDYNLEAVALKYSVNGGDWQTIAFSEPGRRLEAQHVFMLEAMRTPQVREQETSLGAFTIISPADLDERGAPASEAAGGAEGAAGEDGQQPGDFPENAAATQEAPASPVLEDVPLQPGDLISYYAEASDRTQTVRTDIFFIQVQPFSRRYSQSQISGGAGAAGGPQDEISERQRQIIVSTWNLIREREEGRNPGQIEVNSTLLSELQITLAEQAQTLAQRTRARQLSQDQQIEEFVENLERAVQSMHPASERLAAFELNEAIQPAQEALQYLLRAESVFNDITITRQQGGGGAGGGAQRDLAEMFELEMDLEVNQYEAASSVSPQARQQEMDDIMSQLDELARRQEQLADNLRNQRQLTETQRYQQEMLRRQAEELQERLEQLQRGQQSGQPGQGSQQSQQGQDGEQGQQQNEQQASRNELQRRLNSAIRAMNEAAEAMRDGSPAELQRAAEEAQRQLEGAGEQLAQDQLADMRRSFSDMAETGNDMLSEQRRMERVLQEAMETALRERESGVNPDSRGMAIQEEWQLAREKAELAAQLQNLQEAMLSAMQRFGDEAPEAGRELERANQELVDSELEQAISNAALYIDAGYGLYIAGNESAVTAELRDLAQRLERARNLVEEAATPGNSPLDLARQQAQELRSRLQAAGGQPNAAPNEAAGNPGEQGPRFGPWDGGDRLARGPVNLPEGFYGNLDEFTQQARTAIQNLELNAEELAAMYDLIRQLEATRLNRNEAILAREYGEMLALLEQLEAGLQMDAAGDDPNNVRAAVSDVIPDEYRESVAEYYRRLSR